jgi:copper resistance protein B
MKPRRFLTPALLIVVGLSWTDARAQALCTLVRGDAEAGQGHTGHSQQSKPKPDTRPVGKDPSRQDPHAGHEQPTDAPKEPIPPVTDADRAAAFPEVAGHAVHDGGIHYYVLFDQLEWQSAEGGRAGSWANNGWVGGDINRFWFRTEGEGERSRLGTAQAHALYGRAFARWWDVVLGIRQDFQPGPAQTWAVVGIQGLAPYWFDIEATAYVGASGRTHARFEAEYELLLTNRLILQPIAEFEIHGTSDRERGIGVGLSTIDAGIRLRYEIRREFAPYVGLVWSRKFFGTADFAREAGEEVGGTRLALGARMWF